MPDKYESAIARLMKAITRSGGSASASMPHQRLSDTRKAKAEVILTGEQTDALRDFLRSSKRRK